MSDEQNANAKIDRAELAIGAILAELEHDTGRIVRELGFREFDATSIESERREVLRRVVIGLWQAPGSIWERSQVQP